MSVIVTQTTARYGTCPTCGEKDVYLADVMELPTRRILEVRCESCWDEDGAPYRAEQVRGRDDV